MEAQSYTITMAEQQKAVIENTVKKEKRRLFDFIRKRVKTEEDAQDILQDVFLQLAASLEPIEKMTAWLFRVARNRITDLYRKKKTEKLDDLFYQGEDDDLSLHWEELIPGSNDTDSAWLREMMWQELMAALDEIPSEQAEVFAQHELQGMSFKQISKGNGVPVRTLISRKRYAVLQLREKLEVFYDELVK